MNSKNYFSITLIILILIAQNVFSQHALFQGLGDLPDSTFESRATKVSADGTVVVGTAMSKAGEQAFKWTQSTGMISLGNLPDNSLKTSEAYNISADGKVIVGSGDPGKGLGWDGYKGFKWTQDSGMVDFGSLGRSERYEVFSASADGSVIVGDGGQQAFRWKQGTGIEGIGVLPNRTNSRAVDISDDGSVVIGQSYSLPAWNDEDGFIWTENHGMRAMSTLTGGRFCMMLVISPDGSVIAGTTRSSSTYPAFFWTESKGMINIGHLPGKNTTHPGDMTPFGRIIVGGSFSGPTSGEAFIWDSTNGMRNLKTVLQTEYDLDLTGWTLQNASGITPDGKIIVGYGINPDGNQEAFRIELDTLFTDVQEAKKQGLIKNFELKQNYPNPFNPSTTICYSLEKPSKVKLSVYNLLGQEIKTLVNEFQTAGNHSFIWNGINDKRTLVCSGVYFYRLETNGMALQKKMILLL